MKRRIIYKLNKATKQTDILCMQVAEELEEIELKYLDLDYEQDKDKFDRAKKFYIEDNKVIFELYDINENILKEKKQTEKELLEAKSTIVDLQYNNVLNNKEKVGK